MFFEPIRQRLKAVGELRLYTLLRLLFSSEEVREEVIRLNTEEQLFAKGIDSMGTSLEQIGGEYASATIVIKIDTGLPFDRITLYQTGEFYESFTVEAGAESFTIDADTVKGTFDLRERWGMEILGLTEQSKEDLTVLLKELIAETFIELWGNG